MVTSYIWSKYKAESDKCPECKTSIQTLEHFFLQCPNSFLRNQIHIMCYNLQMIPTIKNALTCDEILYFVVLSGNYRLTTLLVYSIWSCISVYAVHCRQMNFYSIWGLWSVLLIMIHGLLLFLVKEWEHMCILWHCFLVKFRWFFGVANQLGNVYSDVKLKKLSYSLRGVIFDPKSMKNHEVCDAWWPANARPAF